MMDKEPANIEVQHTFPPLDASYYNPRPEEVAFFKELTGIEDDAALKEHILKVQAKAYQVASPFGSVCSKTHWFTTRLPLTGASIFSFS